MTSMHFEKLIHEYASHFKSSYLPLLNRTIKMLSFYRAFTLHKMKLIKPCTWLLILLLYEVYFSLRLHAPKHCHVGSYKLEHIHAQKIAVEHRT